jgi:integrase
MRTKLQDKTIKALKFDPSSQNYYRDELVPGLELRVGKNSKTFFVLYNNAMGRKRRYKIGRFPSVKLADARLEAADIKERAENEGYDPAGEKRIEALGAPRKPKENPVTIAEAVDTFMEIHVKKNNKNPDARREHFDRYIIPHLGELNISDLTRQHGIDLVELLEEKHGAPTANRAIQAARSMINILLDKNKIPLEYNPLNRIKADKREVARDRVLTDEEVRSIFKDLNSRDTLYSDILKVLFYTGLRRGEVAGMRRQEIDLDAKVLNLPKERTKNSKPHQVHLSDPVIEIIERRMAETDGDMLFGENGTTAYSGWSRSKDRLVKRCKVEGWRLHDIRRTVVTDLNEYLKAPPHIVEAAVNHISGAAKAGVAGVYNRALYKDERIKLLDDWAAYLDNVILTAEKKVVPLHG